MPNIRSASKRVRQTKTRSERNRSVKSRMKTARKGVLAAIEAGDKEKAEAQYRLFVSTVDKAAKSAVIHKNAAGRYKSGLNRALAGLGA